MLVSPEELQQWVAELRAGNNQVLTVIFQRYGHHCIRTLRRQTQCSEADAEDILQDALLLFRTNMLDHKITHTQNIQGYLYTICRNLQRARAQQAGQRATQQSEVLHHLYGDSYEPSPVESTLHQQETERKLAVVSSALSQLRPGCQRILRLFYLQHQTIPEITEQMKLANDAVTRSTKSQCLRCWIDQITHLQGKEALNNYR